MENNQKSACDGFFDALEAGDIIITPFPDPQDTGACDDFFEALLSGGIGA